MVMWIRCASIGLSIHPSFEHLTDHFLLWNDCVMKCTFDPTSFPKDGFVQGKKDSDRRWTNNQRERVRNIKNIIRKNQTISENR